MWRSSPSQSKEITLVRIISNDDKYDDYGNPELTCHCTALTAEVYPYSDILKRKAIGITTEEAFTVIMKNVKVNSNDVAVIDDIVFRICSISPYDPLQMIVKSTGQKLSKYLQTVSED